jgi:hypothetical protein
MLGVFRPRKKLFINFDKNEFLATYLAISFRNLFGHPVKKA